MTPKEYIDKLKDAQCVLNSVKEDLDRAICKMQQRVETGCESFELDSRLASLVAGQYLALVSGNVYETATSNIEL